MASRQDWLDAGLVILAEHGARSLTIERLMERMRLTKGSFYHHFKGMPGFKAALVEHYEAELTTRYIEAAEQGAPAPEVKIERLLELVFTDERPDPEVAVRAWAMQDDDVANRRPPRAAAGHRRRAAPAVRAGARQDRRSLREAHGRISASHRRAGAG